MPRLLADFGVVVVVVLVVVVDVVVFVVVVFVVVVAAALWLVSFLFLFLIFFSLLFLLFGCHTQQSVQCCVFFVFVVGIFELVYRLRLPDHQGE